MIIAVGDQRVYVTASAQYFNPSLSSKIPTYAIISKS